MSLPAPSWPYAFWPARLDLALTGLPLSCKDSTPPLDALRPRFVQAALLEYVLPIAKAVLLPRFFSAKLGNVPFSERLYPGTKRKREGKAKYEITGIRLELDKIDTGNHTIEGYRSSVRMGSLYFTFLAYLFLAQTLPIVRLVDEIGVPGEEEEKEDLNRKHMTIFQSSLGGCFATHPFTGTVFGKAR
ncbi:uncharacterized protein HKW66_Vig0181120 [Vigna angularis]|uniref:Uncharacterized protein n=1 Tax=Phaseolus angularis TaxID=3914 RepID=A0A8T0K485_PHAAN|nr:uncharacterized protein HKW66_Vig0181120 [Vigna angularis]